jgi:hypothetical protein
MSAKIAVTSSVTWLTGWIVPIRRCRAGSVTSSHSARRRSSSAASASAAFFAVIAAFTSSFSAFRAGPATCRSSGLIWPNSRIFRLISPFLPRAATRSSSSDASSEAAPIRPSQSDFRLFKPSMSRSPYPRDRGITYHAPKRMQAGQP